MNAARQLKKKPPELENLVELPDSMRDYWIWFNRLSNHRPSGMGISSIPYTEMKAFFDLMGIVPEIYEIEILEMFDNIAMKYYHKQREKEQAKSKQKAKR